MKRRREKEPKLHSVSFKASSLKRRDAYKDDSDNNKV